MNKETLNRQGLRDYWQIFLRRKWLIILPIIISVSIAIPLSSLMTPIYVATSMLQTDFDRTALLQGFRTLPSDDMNNIKFTIERRQFMKNVADRVNIAAYLRSVGKPTGLDEEVKYLRSLVKLKYVGSGIIQISVHHPKPDIAKNIADTIAKNYYDNTLRRRQETADYSASFIEKELENYRKKLYETESAIVEAHEKGIFDSLSSEDSLLIQEVAKLRSDLVEVEIDLQEAKGEFQNLKSFASKSDSEFSRSNSFTNPEITDLEAKMAGLNAQYNQLSMKYTDQYPQMKSLKNEILKTQKDLKEAKAKYTPNTNDIKSELAYWEEKITSLELKKSILNSKIKEYDSKLQSLPKRQMGLAELQREKAANESIYSMLLSRLNESDLMRNTEYSSAQTLTELPELAIEPDKPVSPNKKRTLIMAIMVGVCLGCGPAFLLEYFNKSFHSVDETEAYLELPVLATIPRLSTPNSEIQKQKRKKIFIICLVFLVLLALTITGDLVSAKLLHRNSFSSDALKDGKEFLKSYINK